MTDAVSPAADRPPRWYEDYPQGAVQILGSFDVDEAEVIAFAIRYDPQPFHIDPAAARQSPYGGLIASGWHTASMMMRLLADHYLHPVSSLGSPGIDELRWIRPVRPGQRMTVRATVLEARRSASKPDRGLVRTLFEVIGPDGEVAMKATAMNLLRVKPTV